MRGGNQYNALNYHDNSKHYRDFIVGGKAEAMAKTWLSTDSVDAWRHHRMYHVLDPLLADEDASWLTIGDGRYGRDSRYIAVKGRDVMATDIDDSLLREAVNLGFITKYSKENAESLSFSDSTFDYVFCKESYHHFPRPMIALYEMLRVATKGVVMIEPNDQYINYSVVRNISVNIMNKILSLLYKNVPLHNFEEFGNYVYTISRREMEKVALGMNYRYLAFKGINDYYIKGVEFEKISDNGRLFRKIKSKIHFLDLLTKLRLIDHGMLVTILFKHPPTEGILNSLKQEGFDLVVLPENPHPHGQNT